MLIIAALRRLINVTFFGRRRGQYLLTQKEIEVLKLRKANLTQIEVAKKLGISQAAVSSFEKNALRKIEESHKMLKLANQMKLNGVINGKP